MTTITANGRSRYGHHRRAVAIIIIVVVTKEDMTMVWNEDW
jgi:hypothetical protein